MGIRDRGTTQIDIRDRGTTQIDTISCVPILVEAVSHIRWRFERGNLLHVVAISVGHQPDLTSFPFFQVRQAIALRLEILTGVGISIPCRANAQGFAYPRGW